MNEVDRTDLIALWPLYTVTSLNALNRNANMKDLQILKMTERNFSKQHLIDVFVFDADWPAGLVGPLVPLAQQDPADPGDKAQQIANS